MSRHRRTDHGFSLVEVMTAMVISGIVLLGAHGALELSSRYVFQGHMSTRALALAQARIEAKRSVRWQDLLNDDLDHDGIPEVTMKDDGAGHDKLAGDGVYTAEYEHDRITIIWTLAPEPSGPWLEARAVAMHVTALYPGFGETKQIRLAAIRANPTFVGTR